MPSHLLTCLTIALSLCIGANAVLILHWSTIFGETADQYLNYELKDGQLPCSDCLLTSNRSRIDDADILLWHVRDYDPNDLPPDIYWKNKENAPLWVYHSMEAVLSNEFRRRTPDFVSKFDARMVINPKRSNIPISYAPSSFNVAAKPVVDPRKRDSWAPTYFAASNCNSASGREYWVKMLQKYTRIHSIGHCMPNGPPESHDLDLNSYKFYLSFENTLCNGHVTEKYWKPFMFGLVPIVLAGSETDSHDIFEQYAPADQSIILANSFASPRDLADYINYLDSNFTAYLEYLSYKEGIDDILARYGVKKQPLRAHYSSFMNSIIPNKWCTLCGLANLRRVGSLELKPLEVEDDCVLPPDRLFGGYTIIFVCAIVISVGLFLHKRGKLKNIMFLRRKNRK